MSWKLSRCKPPSLQVIFKEEEIPKPVHLERWCLRASHTNQRSTSTSSVNRALHWFCALVHVAGEQNFYSKAENFEVLLQDF